MNNLITWFKNALVRLKARKVYNHTYKQLSNLSDRDLRDIGIHRCDIERIAIEAAEDRYREVVTQYNSFNRLSVKEA